MNRIYLDHAATTPLLPEGGEAMRPWLDVEFGNASSLHAEGRAARRAIDQARETLSHALNCDFAEIIFISSGTEAANLAIVGAAIANTDTKRSRILFSSVEHHCVLEARPILERLGFRVETIPVDREARISLDKFEEMLEDDVLLVSVMHANNELGTIQPIKEVSDLAQSVGALFHSDIVQTFIELDSSHRADLKSISAHKVYGPKGIGALYIRAGTKIKPLSVGGGQERELRAGTENVAAIAGFAAAVDWLKNNPSVFENKLRARDAFVGALSKTSNPRLRFSVETCETVSGHAHLRFEGLSAESMLIVLDRMGVSASSGAACSSGSIEPSHVLLACGYSQEEAREGLRFTFGIHSSEPEALEASRRVEDAAAQVALGKPDRVGVNR